ncbi:unnamed protein product [Adineta steineri]|uniref:Serpin domain-containing protein n=1 Tax=Adineta steineri TaxID=433720 RepID=A0A814AST1_9BILA|nr:unnamed protein product [Adineta steineri]CAF0919183.1 unnamed protein product [Adineta steineri]
MFSTLFVFVLFVSYSETKPASSKPVKVEKNIDDFHLNLYKNVVALNSNENVFISPYSVGLALASVTAGTQGKTEKELLNLLHSKSREKLTQSSKQLMAITNTSEIKLANRLYVDTEFSVLPSYTKQLQKTYNFTLASVNLNAQNKTPVINQINQWVSNQTNNNIKEVLSKDSLDPKGPNDKNELLIINCLFFDGKWESEFQAQNTRDGNTFYPDVGPPQEKKLTLMTRIGSFSYVDMSSTIGARMIHMPFQNKDFTFTIILPNKNVTLAQVESRLTPAIFNTPTTNQMVVLAIPKWKFEFDNDMKDVLSKKMKISELFSRTKANLKELSPKKYLHVSNIFHKTSVVVDEKGVRAAAASVVRVITSGTPLIKIYFTCDKPFLYAIRYKQTILFIGRYVKAIDTSNMPAFIDGGLGR